MTAFRLTLAALLGVLAFLLAVMLMNRGDPWFVNVRAQKEPIFVGVGVFVLVAQPGDAGAWVAGALAFAVALAGRYVPGFDV